MLLCLVKNFFLKSIWGDCGGWGKVEYPGKSSIVGCICIRFCICIFPKYIRWWCGRWGGAECFWNVQSLLVFAFVFVFVFFQKSGSVGDEEKRSVFEMSNRCFSNKCFRDTVRKVNIAHGTSPSVGMRIVWKTIWKYGQYWQFRLDQARMRMKTFLWHSREQFENMGDIDSSDLMMMIAMTLKVGNDLNWVRLMIFFSPFDGSLSSITDLQKDPSMIADEDHMMMMMMLRMMGYSEWWWWWWWWLWWWW